MTMSIKPALPMLCMLPLMMAMPLNSRALQFAEPAASVCSQFIGIMHALEPAIHQKGADGFFVIEPPSLGPHAAPISQTGWEGLAPSKQLLNNWSHRKPGSLLSCARGNRPEGGPIISSGDETRIRRVENFYSSKMFVRIGMPVFDRSRTHALLLYVSQGISVGGRAEMFHLAHHNKRWTVAGRLVVWVS